MLGSLWVAAAWAVPWVGPADGPRPDDAVTVAISELAARPPRALIGGAVEACDGPRVALDAWWTQARAIEGELLYMNEARALALSESALQAATCLDDGADPTRIAQVAFWRGLALHYLQRPDESAAAFAWARSANPALVWNDDLGADGRDRFERARPTARARLTWVAPGFGGALLDGRPLESGDEVVPGHHLLQLRDPSGAWLGMQVHAVAPETRIGVPAALDTHSPSMADDPDSRAILTDLLAAALGPGEPVYVAGTRVWRGTTGRTDWSVVPGTRTVKRGRPLVVAAGGAVAVVGLVTAGAAYRSAARADQDRCDAITAEEWAEADGRWKQARTQYGLGWTGVALGVGLGTTGALLPRQEVSAQVWLGPDGGGLRLAVTR